MTATHPCFSMYPCFNPCASLFFSSQYSAKKYIYIHTNIFHVESFCTIDCTNLSHFHFIIQLRTTHFLSAVNKSLLHITFIVFLYVINIRGTLNFSPTFPSVLHSDEKLLTCAQLLLSCIVNYGLLYELMKLQAEEEEARSGLNSWTHTL